MAPLWPPTLMLIPIVPPAPAPAPAESPGGPHTGGFTPAAAAPRDFNILFLPPAEAAGRLFSVIPPPPAYWFKNYYPTINISFVRIRIVVHDSLLNETRFS